MSKVYTAGEPPAVDDVSFTVGEGEFFSLLGPSGSGKTTTLRVIAGLRASHRGPGARSAGTRRTGCRRSSAT